MFPTPGADPDLLPWVLGGMAALGLLLVCDIVMLVIAAQRSKSPACPKLGSEEEK